MALNFKAVLVFSVSFLSALSAATDFGLIFPIAFLAASILGTTVLKLYSTSDVLSSICFLIASISTCFFSAFSLLILALSVSTIICSNFSFVSFCLIFNSSLFFAKFSFISLTVSSVSIIFWRPLLIWTCCSFNSSLFSFCKLVKCLIKSRKSLGVI